MNSRLLLAGLAAGLVMFVWGGISHMVLPLGEVGIQKLPDEAAVTAAIKDKVPAAGLYLYPHVTDAAELEKATAVQPRGILTVTPAGTPFSMGGSLGTQCINDILVGLVLAWLLSKAAPSVPGLGGKICFALGLALLMVLGWLLPFWNWYGFSLGFVAAGAVDSAVGAILAAVVITKVMRW